MEQNMVSIIMPCFNDGEYIEQSVESVLNQTYKNIELIIIDDGSTDAYTIQKIESLKNNDERIIVYSQKFGGPSKARNYGIKMSRGKYILPVDSDDIIDKTYVEKAVKILNSDENIGAVYCKAELFGEKTGLWDLPEYSFEQMMLDNIVFITAVFLKSDWEKVNGFNENMVNGMEDYDFWLSILQTGKKIVQIPEVLFKYRIKTKSRTTNFQSDKQKVKDMYRQILLNHSDYFKENYDIVITMLRNALIDHIFENRVISNELAMLRENNKSAVVLNVKESKAIQFLKKIPIVGSLLKKIYLKIIN